MEVWLHAFLTSALDIGEWSPSRPRRSTPWKDTGNHWMKGYVFIPEWVGCCGEDEKVPSLILPGNETCLSNS